MIPERFKEIKARCEAGTGGCIYTFVPEDSVGMLVILTLNSATGKAHNEFIAHSFQDLPDCLDEIERLQELLKRIRDDKGGDVWCTFSFNPKKAIDKVLETT